MSIVWVTKDVRARVKEETVVIATIQVVESAELKDLVEEFGEKDIVERFIRQFRFDTNLHARTKYREGQEQ